MPNHDSHYRIVLITVACAFSALALVALYTENVSVGVLLLALISYLFWFIASRSVLSPLPPADATPITMIPSHEHPLHVVHDPKAHGIEYYYLRLLGNIEQGWRQFDIDHRHTEKALGNVVVSLDKALDLAKSTGMLAANAMMSAVTCGEVGRGFVTVSRDLMEISDRSVDDLRRMRQTVAGLAQELSRSQLVIEHPLDFWMVSSAGLPMGDLIKLRTAVSQCQKELGILSDGYRRSPQLDVRWLQIGDAVKRLLNELINTLYQLELHLNDVLSDMRLLKLAESTSDRQQIVEIKDRIHAARDMGGLPQKFIQ